MPKNRSKQQQKTYKATGGDEVLIYVLHIINICVMHIYTYNIHILLICNRYFFETGSHHVDQAGLKITGPHLPLSLECWY